MNARLTTSSSLLSVLAASSVALAQGPTGGPDQVTPAPVAAPGAPATTPVNDPDLSQINGQLVKVGEHNDYHYSFRRFNLSSNPLGWLVGFYGLTGSYAVSNHIALKGDANIYNNIFDSDVSGSEFGLGASIYLRRTYQGPFIEPGFIVRRTSDRGFSDSNLESHTTAGPQMLAGWHWTWDSGFNMALASGFGRNLNGGDRSKTGSDTTLFLNGYMRIGYAF